MKLFEVFYIHLIACLNTEEQEEEETERQRSLVDLFLDFFYRYIYSLSNQLTGTESQKDSTKNL